MDLQSEFDSNSRSEDVKFFVMQESYYKHLLSFKGSVADLATYSKLRKIFSQEDMANIYAYNRYFWNELLPKRLYVSIGSCQMHSFSINSYEMSAIWSFANSDESNEFYNTITSLGDKIKDDYVQKLYEDINMEEVMSIDIKEHFKILPMQNTNNYLIVFNEVVRPVLKVSSKLLEFITECLKTRYKYSSIEQVASTYIYSIYLALLSFKQANIVTI